jgi:hypothetical protein
MAAREAKTEQIRPEAVVSQGRGQKSVQCCTRSAATVAADTTQIADESAARTTANRARMPLRPAVRCRDGASIELTGNLAPTGE